MTPPPNNTKTVLSFQLVLDAENVVISNTTQGKIRANITGLEAGQIERIIDSITDAGPGAVEEFKRLVNVKLNEDNMLISSKKTA